ncbi:hypothetical protein [Butyrivibrio sp. JL13D10]|uniref:hypothetical protein n=1 Tax=Butyrivibrio sp. JL13D10 TaxID=3236815 RepID=UPI0038B4E8AA
MSKGIGAHANLIAEDEHSVMYEYGGYNLNDQKYRNENHLYDGAITIQKECFVEPEIHEKLKKMPSGRKRVIVKRIPVSVNYGKMIEDGAIKVENCSNCWKATEDDLKIDVMALHLLFYIFRRYQEDGKIPDIISYNV